MAYKDIASGYSRFHSMVLQNILHRFSKGEREVKIRDGKEKDTFRPETSLVSSASGSGTKSSNMLNILRPESTSEAENEAEYKEGSNVDPD